MTALIVSLLALAVAISVAFYWLYTAGESHCQAVENYRIALNRELAKSDNLRQEISDLEEELHTAKFRANFAERQLHEKKVEKEDLASRLLHATTKLDAIRSAIGIPEEDDGPSDDMLAAWRGMKSEPGGESTRVEKSPPATARIRLTESRTH